MNSQSVEDYLKAIYQIQERQNGRPVSTSSLASWLSIKSPSVTAMVKRMAATSPRLVDYEPYGGVTLTETGHQMALEIIRHHRLIECFLSQVLGYSWDEVHDEAERLEHVISETMEERIANTLGNPHIDPHGDPIPDHDGHIQSIDTIRLTELPEHHSAVIQRITGQEPELLRYLTQLGLNLSTRIQVVSKASFDEPIQIRLKDRLETILALSPDVANNILVQPSQQKQLEETS